MVYLTIIIIIIITLYCGYSSSEDGLDTPVTPDLREQGGFYMLRKDSERRQTLLTIIEGDGDKVSDFDEFLLFKLAIVKLIFMLSKDGEGGQTILTIIQGDRGNLSNF